MSPDGNPDTVSVFVPDSVVETGGFAASFVELDTSGGELSSEGSINLSILDGGSVELEAVSILDGMDALFTTPVHVFVPHADSHVSPVLAVHAFSVAISLMEIPSVGSGFWFKLMNLSLGSSNLDAGAVFPGVDSVELDDIGGIDLTFMGSTDFVSVGVLASDWFVGAVSPVEVFSVSSGSFSEHLNSLISGGERNAGTVVVHVDSLVEDGEWSFHRFSLSEFSDGDSVFGPFVDLMSVFAWTEVTIHTVFLEHLTNSVPHRSALGVNLPAVTMGPDVTFVELGDGISE